MLQSRNDMNADVFTGKQIEDMTATHFYRASLYFV